MALKVFQLRSNSRGAAGGDDHSDCGEVVRRAMSDAGQAKIACKQAPTNQGGNGGHVE